jgi:hypothetical protein
VRGALPVIRPLCLVDPDDPRGWEISDAYFFGPSLWVAPVLEEGARAREVPLPRGKWIKCWTGAPVVGGDSVVADAPLERIPVFVRAGSIVVAIRASRWRLGWAMRRWLRARSRSRCGGGRHAAGRGSGWPTGPGSGGAKALGR